MMFAHTIIITGDCSSTDIDMFSYRGITEVAKVVHICLRAYMRIFDFCKIPYTYTTLQICARATMAERPHAHIVLENRMFYCRVPNDTTIPKDRLINSRPWSNAAR